MGVVKLSVHRLSRQTKRKRPPQWFDAAVGNREKLSEFVETTDIAFSHGACFSLASAFQRYLTDTEQSLSIVNQPSLVIWGEADRTLRHRSRKRAASRRSDVVI